MNPDELIGRTITKIFETKPSIIQEGIPGPASYFHIVIELDDSNLYELGAHKISKWTSNEYLMSYEPSNLEVRNNFQVIGKRISKVIQRDSEVHYDGSLTLLMENNIIVEHQAGNGDQLFINEFNEEDYNQESFIILTSKIEGYTDFQQVAHILKQIWSFISPDTDTVWAGFDDANEFLKELDQDIARIESCCYETLEKVHVEFMATGTYQELSISNGWSDNYIQLANTFDKLYTKLIESKTAINNPVPKVKKTWWERLFSS